MKREPRISYHVPHAPLAPHRVYRGVPAEIVDATRKRLPSEFLKVVEAFEREFRL
jgi:hypothetical protein